MVEVIPEDEVVAVYVVGEIEGEGEGEEVLAEWRCVEVGVCFRGIGGVACVC